jgi:hypothetical protein
MDNYIKIYDDVLDNDSCQNLIDKFEKSKDLLENVNVDDGDNAIAFKQLTLLNHDDWKPFQDSMLQVFQHYIMLYKIDCKVFKMMWPEEYGYEAIRIKRYLPNDYDRFDPHVDVMTHETSRRFLAFFIYLNDVEEGGETEFINLNKEGTYLPYKVTPKRGRLLMFPPMWPWYHAGRKSVSGKKYLLHSYCHYG